MISIGWLFPGQGAQNPGMGQKFIGSSTFKNVIDKCESITNKPIYDFLTSLSSRELVRTDRAQLAIFAMSMGIVHCLREEGSEPSFVAGHSLGHLTALATSGTISLQQAASLVDARGQLMLTAGKQRTGSMAIVQGLDLSTVTEVLLRKNLDVWPANLNLLDQIVVSGAIEALDETRLAIISAGGRWLALNVSGAFHTPLMAKEALNFSELIEQISFNEPICPIISNRNGKLLNHSDTIKADLKLQMTAQVDWMAVMDQIGCLNPDGVVEIGPGKILTGLMLRYLPKLKTNTTGTPALLTRTLHAIQSILIILHFLSA